MVEKESESFLLNVIAQMMIDQIEIERVPLK
jgi:hypothetical protein